MPYEWVPFIEWLGRFLQENWQTAISALSGTFLGAYLAFLFQRRHTEKKETEANLAAAKAAQFALAVRLNAAKNIQQQVLNPLREDKDRHLMLKPFFVHAEYPHVNIASLTFMLKGEGAQLLNEIMVVGHQFDTLLGALEQRNVRHEAMQRRTSECGPQVGLDHATVMILKDVTDSIYGLGDDVERELQSVFESFRVYIEKVFPETKALSIGFKE